MGRGDTILQHTREHLMIHHIVVALIGAAAPRRGAQEIEDRFIIRLIRSIHHHAEPTALVGEISA